MQPSAIMTGALRLKPNLAVAYINRAIVHRDKGEYDAALRDYDMALRLESYASLYLNRGFVRFAAGRFTDAAADFADGLRIAPTPPYYVLWLHLSRARAGQDDRNEFARNTAAFLPIVSTNQAFSFSMAVDWESWPRPVIGFLLRQVPADQLLNAARALEYLGEIPDPRNRRVPRCDAVFFIGEQEILGRNITRARQRLREVLGFCPPTYYHYFVAKAELSRMSK